MLYYQILACTIQEQIYKSHLRTMDLKHQLQHRVDNLNYLMSQTPY